MNDIKKQSIIYHLNQWMQIVRVGENKGRLLIEGRLITDASLLEILSQSRAYIRSIRRINLNGGEYFEVKPAGRRLHIPHLHLILFLLTVLTTLFAGAIMEGSNPLKAPLSLVQGIPFSLTLLLILGIHELGHYRFARKHHVDATLPYFIPAPTIIGTFGAFIKMPQPVRNRRALLEIGAAGPIAGFLVAVPALFIGLSLSEVVPAAQEGGIQLGESLMMKLATWIVHPGLGEGQDVVLHPMAFAAWIGMLVTMLNLLPIGQLDGGHIAYALLGKWYKKVAWGALGAILILSIFSPNWLVWAALVFFLIRVKHPPIYGSLTKPTRYEISIGVIALVIFVLTFIPVPFRI